MEETVSVASFEVPIDRAQCLVLDPYIALACKDVELPVSISMPDEMAVWVYAGRAVALVSAIATIFLPWEIRRSGIGQDALANEFEEISCPPDAAKVQQLLGKLIDTDLHNRRIRVVTRLFAGAIDCMNMAFRVTSWSTAQKDQLSSLEIGNAALMMSSIAADAPLELRRKGLQMLTDHKIICTPGIKSGSPPQ